MKRALAFALLTVCALTAPGVAGPTPYQKSTTPIYDDLEVVWDRGPCVVNRSLAGYEGWTRTVTVSSTDAQHFDESGKLAPGYSQSWKVPPIPALDRWRIRLVPAPWCPANGFNGVGPTFTYHFKIQLSRGDQYATNDAWSGVVYWVVSPQPDPTLYFE